MTAQAQASVDGVALRDNLRRVRELAPGSRVMAVIKANAYGHGIVPVARALAAADSLAVARLSEAIAVRDAGCRNRVLLLEGLTSPQEHELAARFRLDIVVHRPGQLAMLKAYQGNGQFSVWLKIDTGMNRLGFPPDDAPEAWRALDDLRCVESPPRLMTHFSSADDAGEDQTRGQIERFASIVSGWPGERTLANSAGILRFPDAHADWVRPGLMLYGVSPLAERSAEDLGLTPVMTLWSRVIAVKRVRAGERVGYGGVWTAQADTLIGIVAAGYGDGYPWRLKSGTPVLIGNQHRPLVGRVSMDMIAVNLGLDSDVKTQDKAILWGPGLAVEDIAARAGTIPYELLCGISQRVRLDMQTRSAN